MKIQYIDKKKICRHKTMKVKTETVREIYVIRNKMHKVAIKPKYVQNTFSLLTEKKTEP